MRYRLALFTNNRVQIGTNRWLVEHKYQTPRFAYRPGILLTVALLSR